MTALPRAFLDRPIAHRALHGAGRVENSRAAIRAAVAAGYGIEIDVQPASDGTPMVFHDYDLGRLTGQIGVIATRSSAELAQITLKGTDEPVPTLDEVLSLVAGQVPLVIEIKDQDGTLGPNVGTLESAVAACIGGYRGDLALMSFNPHSMAALTGLTDRPRGLVTCDFAAEHWPNIPAATRDRLALIPDFEPCGASFISHNHRELTNPAVAALKTAGVPILCWTTRSADEDATARQIADNVTFEGYAA